MVKQFSVKLPENPTGRTLKCCFESLIAQMIRDSDLQAPIKRLRINRESREIEIEVEEADG